MVSGAERNGMAVEFVGSCCGAVGVLVGEVELELVPFFPEAEAEDVAVRVGDDGVAR
jgi:hypothetical protein